MMSLINAKMKSFQISLQIVIIICTKYDFLYTYIHTTKKKIAESYNGNTRMHVPITRPSELSERGLLFSTCCIDCLDKRESN